MQTSEIVSNDPKRILICSTGLTDFIVGNIQMGVRRFTLNRPNWQMGYLNVKSSTAEEVQNALNWGPDGILILERMSKVPAFAGIHEVPLLAVDLFHEHPEGHSRLEIDDKGIGASVADYFLNNRFESFAVVMHQENYKYSTYRHQGFCQKLQEQGFEPSTFQVEYYAEQPWHENTTLDTWLESLPKPLAIYCTQDLVALRIVERVRNSGYKIPSEISVVGTDNSQNICEANRPFISSIPQPLELAGFEAAKMLETMMAEHVSGSIPPLRTKLIPAGDVVERESSSLRAVEDETIAAAASYLQKNVVLGGKIPDAAKAAGVNRRTLERGFRKYLGVTPGEYVREIKLNHAKKLLSETDLRMREIAKACGMTQEHFTTFFREDTGMTPSAYRRTRKHPLTTLR